jgi:hypothetical protein
MAEHLGDFLLTSKKFSNLAEVFKEFKTSQFQALNEKEKRARINQSLYELIKETREPCFLLSAVLDFIYHVSQERLVEHYHFSHFELWLNQLSGLSRSENYHVRAKVIGKRVPREEYQILFPIGMGKTYPGSHYVTAHSSPDIDTTIASFWGWVDAFGARVSEGLHLWNVPGGAPSAQVEVEQLFYRPFGKDLFHYLAKDHTSLMLSSIDLISQKGVVEKDKETSMLGIDHERNQSAIILVDEKGYYLGDWRNFDFEGIRQVIELFHLCLRWFENHLYTQLVGLLAKDSVRVADYERFVRDLFAIQLNESRPVKKMSTKQLKHLGDYLIRVLGVSQGLESSFEALAVVMKGRGLPQLGQLQDTLQLLSRTDIFDAQGKLKEDRRLLFKKLEEIIARLDEALLHIDQYVDRLIMSLKIKSEVFGYSPQTVSDRSDVGEIRSKMGSDTFLTVTYSDREGKLIPMGVVHAEELYKPVLGTVSLRDFCNREETKIPSYLEVISVIDHHKTQLTSLSPPVAHISDSQSSNAIVAELAFAINDRYSTGGMSIEAIRGQMKEVELDLSSSANKRIMRRLLQRLMHAENVGAFYIDPEREFLEYLHFVYAILDDTDLLTKISMRDVICMASLLNRLKSLMLQREVEIIHFDDIAKDEQFVATAASRILQNIDMYSLCRRIYLAKEEAVKENLQLCAEGKPSTFFSDTKEQNGCCRVGQAKLYARNFSTYQQHAQTLRQLWWRQAELVVQEKNDVDFHLQMISTVAGAEDLFAGNARDYTHQDEIWLWIPETEQAISHLKSFLNGFKGLSCIGKIDLSAEFYGKRAQELAGIVNESFRSMPHSFYPDDKNPPMIILRFKAGAINSRKAMISPYLPRLVS